jgi:hypothetical protein
MWTPGIVEIEVACNRAAGFANALICPQIHLLVFDASPQTLDEHVAAPSALAIHADCYAPVGKRAGDAAPVNWLP